MCFVLPSLTKLNICYRDLNQTGLSLLHSNNWQKAQFIIRQMSELWLQTVLSGQLVAEEAVCFHCYITHFAMCFFWNYWGMHWFWSCYWYVWAQSWTQIVHWFWWEEWWTISGTHRCPRTFWAHWTIRCTNLDYLRHVFLLDPLMADLYEIYR